MILTLIFFNNVPLTSEKVPDPHFTIKTIKEMGIEPDTILTDSKEESISTASKIARVFGEFMKSDIEETLDYQLKNSTLTTKTTNEAKFVFEGIPRIQDFSRTVMVVARPRAILINTAEFAPEKALHLPPNGALVFEFKDSSWRDLGKPKNPTMIPERQFT